MFILRALYISGILLTGLHEGQLFHIPKFENPHVKLFCAMSPVYCFHLYETTKADVMLEIAPSCKYKEQPNKQQYKTLSFHVLMEQV